MKPLTDNDTMPFGKYKSQGISLKQIPASYFHYLWENGLNAQDAHLRPDQIAVRDYIDFNLDAFAQEDPDLIWSTPVAK